MPRDDKGDPECKVYIGDLPRDANEREIERLFRQYGELRNVWVARNPPGFAFVEFNHREDGERAVRDLDGTMICGVRARVERATGKSRPKPWIRGSPMGFPSDPYSMGSSGFGGGAMRQLPYERPEQHCYKCGSHSHYSYQCRDSDRDRRRSRSRSRSRSRGRKRRSPSRSRSRDRKSRSRDRRSSRDGRREKESSKASRERESGGRSSKGRAPPPARSESRSPSPAAARAADSRSPSRSPSPSGGAAGNGQADSRSPSPASDK